MSASLWFGCALLALGVATPMFAQEGDARDAWVLPDEMGAIYAERCAVCHGDRLQGAAQGPSLLTELSQGDSVDDLARSIAEGVPEKGMPAWSAALTAEEIRGLTIYLLELRQNQTGETGIGIGELPVIPTGPQPSEEHAYRLTTFFAGLAHPYSIAPLPDGRVLVTEKAQGLSLVAADGKSAQRVTGTPRFYDDAAIRGVTYTGNGWAHEVELHPDYEKNGWVYLSYGDRCSDCNERSRASGEPVSMIKLVRGRIVAGEWRDQQTIWEADAETYRPGHELGAGARVAFDDEGYVYLSLGSIQGYEGIQDLALPYGKVHRVHDDGRIPEDGPFVDVAGALPTTWTLGHRNPQGLAFDSHTKRLWEAEHGPRGGDEANILRPGLNYGWPLVSLGVDYDGFPIRYAEKLGIEFDPDDLESTTIDWTPSLGVSSIVFYRGDAFPSWRNDLLVATLKQMELLRVVVDGDEVLHSEVLIPPLGRFRDVEVGPDGAVYLLVEHSKGSQILRMEPSER